MGWGGVCFFTYKTHYMGKLCGNGDIISEHKQKNNLETPNNHEKQCMYASKEILFLEALYAHEI